VLTVERLFVTYGPIRAVAGVSLEVGAGEVVALLGANGAGKTTLLHAIMGVLDSVQGRIAFDGREIAGIASHEIVALGIALVPEGRQLFAEMTVQENLEVSFCRAMRTRLDRRRFDRRLEAVSEIFPRVVERRRQIAGTLSGGEQQMVAIARALMSEPRLLLLDEPSLGLSPVMVDTVMDVIERLHRSGLSILLVEQNAEAALALAERGYVLERGAIAVDGAAAQLLGDPKVQAAYLGL
jgi:branched-chain amino acid transport system ATP-binding protein